ncbi:MAG: NUDIX hydrolase [Alphaproteobacteria bacterium]|nr:MAG: NUDIX hydrolase [Alphaproteobacteria bacterium]
MTDNVPLAATILLLRDRPDEMEVLMVERHRDMKFMGGAVVFPGGKVDADDAGVSADNLPAGFTADDMPQRIAGIREVFEESGLLLARNKGETTYITNERRHQIAEAYRKKVDNADMTINELANVENLELAVDALVPFAHWITPTGATRRYDTMFYVTSAPVDHKAEHDGNESVDSIWISPSQALKDEAAKVREIVFPTRLNIEKLGRQTVVADALEAARNDTVVTVLPTIEDGVLKIPAEAGYNLTEESIERAAHK